MTLMMSLNNFPPDSTFVIKWSQGVVLTCKRYKSMRKINLFFSMFVAAMLLASCGGSDVKMTGDGLFGIFPAYMLKYYELNKQCADEIEFEDDYSKQREIIEKYQQQLSEYANAHNFLEESVKMNFTEIPVDAPEELGIHEAYVSVESPQSQINEPKKQCSFRVQMRYKERALRGCFFLDENDSVIYQPTLTYVNNRAVASVFFYDMNPSTSQYRDKMKYALYALDRVKKIKITTAEETVAYMKNYMRNADKFIASLHDAGILECSSLEELLTGKNESETEEKEEDKKDDKNKPGLADLVLFELRGPVRKMVQKSEMSTNYNVTFSENGKWELTNGDKVANVLSDVKRDSEKRIISYTEGEYDFISMLKITYDDKTGWISKVVSKDQGDEDGGLTTTYVYDENGYVVKEVVDGQYTDMGADEPTKVHTVTTYKYVSFDSYGNWTKRSASNTDGGKYDETRTITYYK